MNFSDQLDPVKTHSVIDFTSPIQSEDKDVAKEKQTWNCSAKWYEETSPCRALAVPDPQFQMYECANNG